MSTDIDFDELATEIHRWAIGKGWWDTPNRSFDEQVANFHAEVSEAWEEWRDGHGLTEIYYSRPGGTSTGAVLLADKPEGIPIELADIVIRILDSAGFYGVPLNLEEELSHLSPEVARASFAKFIRLLHKYLARIHTPELYAISFSRVIAAIVKYCDVHDIDLKSALEIKMKYNETREYRHGGKKA